ncbi:hypothetical protein M3896_002652 [Vibrio metschnikovii]|nr:hypothetical protein [Vibrio metschnikovii]
MTTTKHSIIPFGKYKGQPVEVLANDKAYTDWLLSQSQFKQRNPELFNIIINNFQQPSETPEHNALQVLFLHEDFRAKFAIAAFKKCKVLLEHTIDYALILLNTYPAIKVKETQLALCRNTPEVESKVRHLSSLVGYEINKEKLDFTRSPQWKSNKEELKKQSEYYAFQLAEDLWERNIQPYLSSTYACTAPANGSRVIFEEGYDVYFEVDIPIQTGQPTLDKILLEGDIASADRWHWMRFKIEVKPCVSDDFPAVLRQMKHSGAEYLFIENYTGLGATKDEFELFFASQGITVIYKNEVLSADASLPLSQIAYSQEQFKTTFKNYQ